jgi:Uncharacterised nucleotidyltransferase
MEMIDNLRTWLIAALAHDDLPPIAASDWPNMIAQAEAQGVLVLLANQLATHPSANVPVELLSEIQQQARQALMEQLPFFAEQKNVFQALNATQIPFLVMKGAALGNWLYGSPNHRPVTDIDLWFKDQHTVNSLAEILQPLGFHRVESSGDLTSFEQAFDKDINGYKIRIDAHWAMFNSAILASGMSFDAAYARSNGIEIQQQTVRVLAASDALINSIGHRALKYLAGQADTLKWLYDQHLLLKTLSAEQWQQFIERSAQAGISDLGLDAIEHSQALFKTQIPHTAIEELTANANNEKIKRDWFQSWTLYQWHEMLAVSPNLSGRALWLGQRLWPNPEAMRERYGSGDPAWRFMLKRIGVGLRRLFR